MFLAHDSSAILQSIREYYFFPSQAQSDVYNLTVLRSDERNLPSSNGLKYDVLAAHFSPINDSTSSKLCSLYRFSTEATYLKPVVKPLDFVYIPDPSNIVCIDSLWDSVKKEYVVGIGFVKLGAQGDEESYFNIYSAPSQNKLPDCCLSFTEISYLPLHLTHAFYISPVNGQLQWAFMLSCGNSVAASLLSATTQSIVSSAPIRVFAPLSDGTQDTVDPANITKYRASMYAEMDNVYGELDSLSATRLFPELIHLSRQIILYKDFVMLSGSPEIRLSAFGAEDGWFGVFEVDMREQHVLRSFEFGHDSAITSVKLFCQFPPPTCTGLLEERYNNFGEGLAPSDFSLLVCSSVELAVVYKDIFRGYGLGLSNQLVLPQSADFDQVNCACVGDFDSDGVPEIVIGTFGQRLLFYHWQEPTSDGSDCDGKYELVEQRRLIGPVHSLSSGVDLVGDGVLSFAVLTSRGLHIYQPSGDVLIDCINRRLATLKHTAYT